MNASFSYTWSEEFGNNYFNNRFGIAVPGGAFAVLRQLSAEPERAHVQRVHELEPEVHRHDRRRLGTPRLASAQDAERRALRPFLRGALNYNSAQLFLAEPIGTRRQDTVTTLDFRVEKQLRFAQKARVGLFLDVFNALNSNTAVNINWRSGAAFEKATTVLGPRIAKFGVKFDW